MARRPFRDILRKGRRDLHAHLEVAALYIAYTGAEPTPLTVRVPHRIEDTGDMGSGSNGYAVIAEIIPQIIFMRSDLEDARHGAIFSIEAGEAYKVERTRPPNDITRTADVTRLTASEASGLPVPEIET